MFLWKCTTPCRDCRRLAARRGIASGRVVPRGQGGISADVPDGFRRISAGDG